MTVLYSSILEREGFVHGFGTRRSAPDDLPDRVHILRQVHGERIVWLGAGGLPVKDAGPPPSGMGPVGGSTVGSSRDHGKSPDVRRRDLPADPFRFDEGDAMISDLPGVAMGVRTADCLPLLLADRRRGIAAAVHCGWRSLALEIASKTVMAVTRLLGSGAADLIAALGPSIGPCCYEVGEDVRRAFPERMREGLFETRGGVLYMDLAAGAKTQLLDQGVLPEAVDEIVGCTSCNPDLFWSWRARKEEGRMVSFITTRT